MKQISFLLFTLLLLLTSVLSYSQSLCNAITKKNTRCRNKVTNRYIKSTLSDKVYCDILAYYNELKFNSYY